MSRSKDKNQAKLKQLYGVTFPYSLFWLHEFIVEQKDCEDTIDLADSGLYPSGVLSLLLNFDDIDLVEFTDDPLLHYRYYRDVPEFFTYLSGDCDGQHWGMLLDEPNDGFRGVAMYWSNDGAEITVYDSVFDALIVECQESIDSYEEYLLDDSDDDEYYKKQIEICQKLITRIEEFLAKNLLSLDEGRPSGFDTITGLDIISSNNFSGDRTEAIEMLRSGRELWYWNGADRSTEAYELMRKAYELLERPELIRILDVHYHDRDRNSVDLVRH